MKKFLTIAALIYLGIGAYLAYNRAKGITVWNSADESAVANLFFLWPLATSPA